MNTIRVATISLSSLDGMKECNYQRAIALAKECGRYKPDVILFPEAFASGYCCNDLHDHAENRYGDHFESFQQLSLQYDCMIVYGYLERAEFGVYNAAVIMDQGNAVGVHYKSSLWADTRPYRNEPELMCKGPGMEVFPTRYGSMAVLICYENILSENWMQLENKVDFIVSPYNCEADPTEHNIRGSALIGVPSAWADRTGMVWAGNRLLPNPGTAGIVDASGKVIAKSSAGVEEIIVGEMTLR